MYLIPKDKELDSLRLAKIINSFLLNEQPNLLKYKKYYDGLQQIIFKEPTDDGKPCNRVMVNYCKSIVDNFNGYISGIPIQYNGDDIEAILNVLNYNDFHQEDNDFLHDSLIYGVAYEINYIDKDGAQRFRTLNPIECIPVYSADLDQELLYVIRIYQEDALSITADTKYIVEVYGKEGTRYYSTFSGFSQFILIDEQPNYFNQVPITVFELNKDRKSIFDTIISLQDGYNTLISSEIDDFENFCDAYLMLKGVVADDEDLASMKEHRLLMLDNDSDASYLTKSVNDTQIQNMLENLNNQIYNKANCVDFNDKNFQASTGIALKLKLVGFENSAASIESQMRKALQKRIELICSILNLKGISAWRDIEIVFTRNLPTNTEDIANTVNSLRGLVSNETLLSQIPFVTDVDEELKRVQKEKEEAMSLYEGAFNANSDTTED